MLTTLFPVANERGQLALIILMKEVSAADLQALQGQWWSTCRTEKVRTLLAAEFGDAGSWPP